MATSWCQKGMVRQVLETNGSISKLEAQHMNIGNICDVIMKLRRSGIAIETQSRKDVLGRKYTRWVKVS